MISWQKNRSFGGDPQVDVQKFQIYLLLQPPHLDVFYTDRKKLSTNKDENFYSNKLIQSSLFVPAGGPRRVITAVADESSVGLHMLYEALQDWLFSA